VSVDIHIGQQTATSTDEVIQSPTDASPLKLAARTTTQAVLPFTGLNGPNGVAVDSAAASTSPTMAINGW